MNNYTTARLPLRQSENSQLLLEKLLAPAPVITQTAKTKKKPAKQGPSMKFNR